MNGLEIPVSRGSDRPYNCRMTATDIYQEIVLDHARAPRNFGKLPEYSHAADGVNALCGDTLRAELRCVDGRIVAVCFSGESCAITTATASMLSEFARERTPAEILEAKRRFASLIAGDGADEQEFGPLNALAELRKYPGRRKCAMLPWATLCAALDGERMVSTETPPG
ncbi:MAG: SUF system NifU family Fe-S cluster assembly protein [Rhodanobacteraceae bacterium]